VSKHSAARGLLAATMALTAAGVVFAAPADAGCETHDEYQYCDMPIQPDGTFDRCLIVFGYGVSGVGKHRDGRLKCYRIDPSKFYPWGEPRYHIDP
jgi:hypothetical protein